MRSDESSKGHRRLFEGEQKIKIKSFSLTIAGLFLRVKLIAGKEDWSDGNNFPLGGSWRENSSPLPFSHVPFPECPNLLRSRDVTRPS